MNLHSASLNDLGIVLFVNFIKGHAFISRQHMNLPYVRRAMIFEQPFANNFYVLWQPLISLFLLVKNNGERKRKRGKKDDM